MKFVKSTTVAELQVIGRFEQVRKILLADPYAAHLDRLLVSWALPADRGLPLAFMGRRLGDLLATPFSDLAATPGVGYKKICALITLLARAAATDPAELPLDLSLDVAGGHSLAQEGRHSSLSATQEGRHSCLPATQEGRHSCLPATQEGDTPRLPSDPTLSSDGFDPAAVSEVVWQQWRSSVLRHGLGPEPLGRFAPSLTQLTRVIWGRPLADYAGMSLTEVRGMKSHGEKRIRAVLEVFHAVYSLLAHVGRQEHLVLRIVPRQIDAVGTWVASQLQLPGVPAEEELLARFVEPLLAQLRLDASPQIVNLAENRLGIRAPRTSVRQLARNLGLTRTRVYQLLDEINDVMNVRWPTGRQQVYQLDAKFRAKVQPLEQPSRLEQFQAAVELFYPRSRRGASGMLERIDGPHELGGGGEAPEEDVGPAVPAGKQTST